MDKEYALKLKIKSYEYLVNCSIHKIIDIAFGVKLNGSCNDIAIVIFANDARNNVNMHVLVK